VVVVLFNAGDHAPVIPLVDVVGSAANVPPLQIGDIGANVGVVGLFTVTVICTHVVGLLLQSKLLT
jgi:hypothetical protein